jgi:hypothetical protein
MAANLKRNPLTQAPIATPEQRLTAMFSEISRRVRSEGDEAKPVADFAGQLDALIMTADPDARTAYFLWLSQYLAVTLSGAVPDLPTVALFLKRNGLDMDAPRLRIVREPDPKEARRNIRASNAADKINANLAHLIAMLQFAYGDSGENLGSLSDDLRDDYVWACAERAEDIKRAWRDYCAAAK